MTDPIERIIRMVHGKALACLADPTLGENETIALIYRDCAPSISEEFEAWAEARRELEELDRQDSL